MSNVTEREIPSSLKTIIEKVKEAYPGDVELHKLFENCFLNTYLTTLKEDEKGTFVITGDIPAMWLRDSAAQVRPYLIAAAKDKKLAKMLKSVVKRQWEYILHDPYANAFNQTENNKGHQLDKTEQTSLVWERKYEIDSLCYPIQLTYLYWKSTKDDTVLCKELVDVINQIVDIWKIEQNHEKDSHYRFERSNCRPSDTLLREGKGSHVEPCGMTWSGFRPSDDACLYGYLVPANMFAVVALDYAIEMLQAMKQDDQLIDELEQLRYQISNGIEEYGSVSHPHYGDVYAYEVDGKGQYHVMDDANVPSLLSAAYLGYVPPDNEKYTNTRKLILSKENPFYYEGQKANGIGSPHTPDHYIWHIALAIQGLTSTDPSEIQTIIRTFKETHDDTYYMHEGFDADNPSNYMRSWFAWANSMFSEFILSQVGLFVPGSPLDKSKQEYKGG